jgi:REP element-mobilizing transposase RayT
MGNTYRKVYLQCVFAVKYRHAALQKEWRGEVFKYISQILKSKGHYPLAVNGYIDHVHLFFDYNGTELIPDLIKDVKKSTNAFIRKKFYKNYNFQWQEGYGIFSHGRNEKDKIIKYLKNQDIHHSRETFKEEYLSFLNAHDIEYKEEYLFDFHEFKNL